MTKIENRAKYISDFRSLYGGRTAGLLIPEAQLIQFDLLDIYQNWNYFLGDKNRSFSRFLNIYLNDILLIYALQEAVLALNNLDIQKLQYTQSRKKWQKMNLLIKSHKATYHLVTLTVLLRINYERFLLCLQELFQCTTGKTFEKKKKAVIAKMKKEKINRKLIAVVRSIDVSKFGKYRDDIIHHSGLHFKEFFPAKHAKNRDFDVYLKKIRKEIVKFYHIVQRFSYNSTGKEPKFNLNYGILSRRELEKKFIKTKEVSTS